MPGRTQNRSRMPGRFQTLRELLAHYVGGLYQCVGEHHVFLLASGLAFSIVVCIVPLVLVVFAVLGSLFEKPSIAGEIEYLIERAIPYKTHAEFIKQLVFSRVDEFIVYKDLAGIIGIVGLFLASSGLFSSMRTILNTIFRAAKSEPVLVGKLRDFGLVVLVLLYFLLLTAVLPAWKVTKEFADKVALLQGLRFDLLEDVLLGVVSFALIFGAFFIVYFLVPHERPPKRAVLVSALSAAVLWKVAEQIFGFYIANFITLNRIYGAYTLMIVVAFWIYYTSIVFILAAEVGQLYRERTQKRLPRE